MTALPVTCNVRRHRERFGWSQARLAAQAGVTRQALIAIEGCKRVPSTALALALSRALRCSVEELFALSPGPLTDVALASARLRPADDCESGTQSSGVQRALVGKVEGRWVAHSLDGHSRAAHGLFEPNQAEAGSGTVQPLRPLAELEHNVLVAGCAPLLGILAERSVEWRADSRAVWLPANSRQALSMLAAGAVHIAGVHLEGAGGSSHAEVVRQRFVGRNMTIVHLTRWRQGVLIAPGNPCGVNQVSDLLRPGLRLTQREPGAGASVLLERLLKRAGVSGKSLAFEGPMVSKHTSVAQFVRAGVVDAGVAIESAALTEGLDFIPLSEERFDLVMHSHTAALPHVARVLNCLSAAAFRQEVSHLPGYDSTCAGESAQVEVQA